MRSKRKRIDAKEHIGEVIKDVEVFIQNRCSSYAKWILTSLENIEIEIFFDKHYFIRMQHGDKDGVRIGIDFDDVKKLIVDASKHLFHYANKTKTFSFVNFELLSKQERMVLTQSFEDEVKLNIVVEYHFLNISRYEVTLITAMRKNDFYFSDGCFQLEIQPDGSSALYKSERGKVKLVSEFVK